MSYFCNPCRRVVPTGERCEHWSIEKWLAGTYCGCGREGLSPGQDFHCTECHRDFTRVASDGAVVGDRDAFEAHECVPKPARRRATAGR